MSTLPTDHQDAALQPMAYRIEGVAQLLSVSSSTVNLWLRGGLLRARKAGGTTLIMHSDLMAMLQGLPTAEFAPLVQKECQ